MKILLIGKQGQLGKALAEALPNALVYDRDVTLMLGNLHDAAEHILRVEPDIVINTTAYTDVDKAECESEKCFAVNAWSVGEMAKACNDIGAKFVHFSTVYCDDTLFRSEYARSKKSGENKILELKGLKHLIIRTDCLYTETTGFVGKVMANIAANKPVTLPVNLCGNPTHVNYLVTTTLKLIGQGARGVFTVVGDEYLSRFDWAWSFVPLDKQHLLHSKVLYDKDSIRKLDHGYTLAKGNHKK